MLRIYSKKFRFSQAFQKIDKPQFLQLINLGTDFYKNKKYRLSNEFYKKASKIIQKDQGKYSETFLDIQKKIVKNHIHLKNYAQSQLILTDLIEISKKMKNSSLIYRQYNNLFSYCLTTNLNRSIILGKTLLSEKQKQNLPSNYKKIFLLYLGTAYLLKGNYVYAKQKFRQCLDENPNNLIKGYALNNLAVACWWHKHPNYRALIKQQQEKIQQKIIYKQKMIDMDFENVMHLLKSSIYYIQEVYNYPNQQEKNYLNDLLIMEKPISDQILTKDIFLKSKLSQKPLINITQFLFTTNPQMRNQAMIWFKYAFSFYEKIDPNNMHRLTINLALFCSLNKQMERAQCLFLKVIQDLKDQDSYHKIWSLKLLGEMLMKIPQRKRQGLKYCQQFSLKMKKLPYWQHKKIHVLLPDLDF